MTNEVYRLCLQAVEKARAQAESTCYLFVKPSNMGKTHTAHIVARDAHMWVIPPMSISEQRTWFSERLCQPYFIFDDPSDWFQKNDRMHVFSVLKNLLSGWFKCTRATRFDSNIPMQVEQKACVLLFMNAEQYNLVRLDMQIVGLYDRCTQIYTTHSQEQKQKIQEAYKKYKYSSQNLPHFKKNGNVDFPIAFDESQKAKQYFCEDIEFEE